MAIWAYAKSLHFGEGGQGMVTETMGSIASNDGFPSNSGGRKMESVEEIEGVM